MSAVRPLVYLLRCLICKGMYLCDPALNSKVKNSFTSRVSVERLKIDACGRTDE